MNDARHSLTPAWVTNKQALLAQWNEMYPFLSAVDNAHEHSGGAGYYMPASGDDVPANAAGAGGITANPATAWDTGSFVHALNGPMHWGGAAWADGKAA